MQAGLSVTEAADKPVIVTDDFIATVSGLTSQQDYSTGRGAGVVAARTIPGDDGSMIVVNGPETRNRPTQLIERLLAHEAGHVRLNERKEVVQGRRGLVGANCPAVAVLVRLEHEQHLVLGKAERGTDRGVQPRRYVRRH
jgi:hypothetical protein